MSEATKTKAIEKIDAMEFFIGWLDDDSKRKEWVVQLPAAEPNGRRSFYWDACDLFKQNVAIIIAKAEEASTDTRDIFYAQQMECPSYDANAFYDGKVNCMLILSTNLLPPIFDPNWPDAVNYAVIVVKIKRGIPKAGSEARQARKRTGCCRRTPQPSRISPTR